MPERKGYRLMILADNSTKMRALRFTHRTIIGGSIVAVILIGLFNAFTSRLVAGYMTRNAMSTVLAENRSLHNQIGGLSSRLDQVQNAMSTLAQSDDQLRLLADMPRLDKDIREVGVGGVAVPNTGIDSENPELQFLVLNLDKLEREIQLQKESYAEIESRIKDRRDLITHTPSIRPVTKGYLSSNFGYRPDPFTGKKRHHNGLDISVERGTPVSATADGTVIFAKATPGLGKLVIVDHGYGFRTAYGHLSVINVNKGQRIERGQKIGLTGSTGRSTAPHLHYEVHVNGNPVDPRDFFFEGSDDIATMK